jgi:AbrB family looped-hinge helix DNA binding protein
METTVQLRKKGQVVIPEPVRIALNLVDGDILQIDVRKFDKPVKVTS